MDCRVKRHRELAKFHTEIADQIEKLLQPDARGEEPARPAAAVEATKGGKEDQRKLHLVKRLRPHKEPLAAVLSEPCLDVQPLEQGLTNGGKVCGPDASKRKR